LAIGSIIVARLLGQEDYGLYSLSLVVPAILAGLIDLGVNPALIRYSAKLRAEGKSQLVASVLRSGVLFKLLIGIAMSAICFIFSDTFAIYILNRPGMASLIKLSSVLVIFQTIFTTLNSTFIGLDKTEGNALTMNAQAITKTVFSPLLVVIGFSVAGALGGHIAGYVIASLAGSLLFLKLYRSLGKSLNRSLSNDLKTMVGYGYPLYAATLLGLVLGQYRTIILAFFTTNAEIGNFSIATTLATTITVLIFPLSILFPVFSKLNPKSADLKKVFTLSVKYTALLIIPAAIIVATLSTDIVQTFYGHDYNLAPSFLSLYILTYLYTGAGSIVLSHLFNGIGETAIVFKWNLLNLLILLPLAPLLTMTYGVPGLIASLLTSNLLALAYGLTVAIKKLNVTLDLKASLKIYAASFLSAIPTLTFLHLTSLNNILNLVIGTILFLLSYLTLLPVTKAINQPDLDNFKRMFSKLKILWPLLKPAIAYEAKLLSIL